MRTEWKNRQASFIGPVVATEDFVFFVLKTDIGKFAQTMGMLSMSRATRAMTNGLMDSSLRDECEVTVDDLPEQIRMHPFLAKIARDTKAIVVPKDEVKTIKATWYNGVILTTGSFKYHLSVGFSTYKEVRDFFAINGWA